MMLKTEKNTINFGFIDVTNELAESKFIGGPFTQICESCPDSPFGVPTATAEETQFNWLRSAQDIVMHSQHITVRWTLPLTQRVLTVVRPPTLWNTGYLTVQL